MLGERRRSQRDAMELPPGMPDFAGKPQPGGDTQINRNGLNYYIRASQ